MKFTPVFQTVAVMPPYSIQQIKDEPMLFNCDLEHAVRYGGPLTHQFISRLPKDWLDVPLVFDTKSVMLMPGWFPCIPGWHHDDVERKGDGRPDYINKDKSAQFIMCLLNAQICPTKFLIKEIDLDVPDTKLIYKEWNKILESNQDFLAENTKTIIDKVMVKFSDMTFHTGTKAVAPGWRWFCRVSRYFDSNGLPIPRGNQRTNEIRKQVQVYLEDPYAGW